MKAWLKNLLIILVPVIVGVTMLIIGCTHINSSFGLFFIIFGPIIMPLGIIFIIITNITKFFKFYDIRIKTKGFKHFYVSSNNKQIKYTRARVNIDEIVKLEIIKDFNVIYSSGMGEALVGGLLFGGSGAIAGAMIGQKQKLKGKCVVYIYTNNIKYAGITTPCTPESGFKIVQTLELLKK